MSKKYIKEEGEMLAASVGGSLSASYPPPGVHTVSIEWNVETLWKLRDQDTGREWKLAIPLERVEGIQRLTPSKKKARLHVGMSDGIIIFHNAGKWSAKLHSNGHKESILENVSFKEILEIFRKGEYKASVPVVERLEVELSRRNRGN